MTANLVASDVSYFTIGADGCIYYLNGIHDLYLVDASGRIVG